MPTWNPLPGWMGWVATAIIVIVFAYLFYRQRKKKATDTRSHRWVPVEGFATCWVPFFDEDGGEIDEEMADLIVDNLYRTAKDVWDMCEFQYKIVKSMVPDWYMDTIGMGNEHPSDEHQYVSYSPGAHKIALKVDEQMYYWFAREVHNVFRIFLRGLPHVYDTVGEEDLDNANRVQAAIKDAYYGEWE